MGFSYKLGLTGWGNYEVEGLNEIFVEIVD